MTIPPMTLRLCMILLIGCVAFSHAAEKTVPAPLERKPPCVGMGCEQKEPGCIGLGCGEKELCIGMGCEKSKQAPPPKTIEVKLRLDNKVTSVPSRSSIQREVMRLTAAVTGLPLNSPPPLYQFAIRLGNQTYKTSGEFTAEPRWAWNPDASPPLAGNGQSLIFVVTAKLALPSGSSLQTAEAGPYTLLCDECARRSFQVIADDIVTHARCLNCHASGDSPTQGDDRHLHVPEVNRQVICTQCHGASNGTTPGSPPGTPVWGMPPFSFANKSAAELCRQIKDPARNGGRSLEQLVEHVAVDNNIKWAWNPGLERTTPIGIWNDFAQDNQYLRSFRYWVNAGAACPDADPPSQRITPGISK